MPLLKASVLQTQRSGGIIESNGTRLALRSSKRVSGEIIYTYQLLITNYQTQSLPTIYLTITAQSLQEGFGNFGFINQIVELVAGEDVVDLNLPEVYP